MIPAEHVQRKIAIVPVVSVEEAAFLLPMQRGIGRIQVQHDLFRRTPVSFQENLHEQFIHRGGRITDLVVALGER
jgi:hypothetical protein